MVTLVQRHACTRPGSDWHATRQRALLPTLGGLPPPSSSAAVPACHRAGAGPRRPRRPLLPGGSGLRLLHALGRHGGLLAGWVGAGSGGQMPHCTQLALRACRAALECSAGASAAAAVVGMPIKLGPLKTPLRPGRRSIRSSRRKVPSRCRWKRLVRRPCCPRCPGPLVHHVQTVSRASVLLPCHPLPRPPARRAGSQDAGRAAARVVPRRHGGVLQAGNRYTDTAAKGGWRRLRCGCGCGWAAVVLLPPGRCRSQHALPDSAAVGPELPCPSHLPSLPPHRRPTARYRRTACSWWWQTSCTRARTECGSWRNGWVRWEGRVWGWWPLGRSALQQEACMQKHCSSWQTSGTCPNHTAALQDGAQAVQQIERPADVEQIETLLVAEVVAAHTRHMQQQQAQQAAGDGAR